MPTHENTPANQSSRIGDYVSIHLRNSTWYANYSEDGRQRRISLKTSSKKQARLSALKIENRLLSGAEEARKDLPSQELIQAYIDHIEGGSLARTTKQKYLRVLTRRFALAGWIRQTRLCICGSFQKTTIEGSLRVNDLR